MNNADVLFIFPLPVSRKHLFHTHIEKSFLGWLKMQARSWHLPILNFIIYKFI